MTTQEKIKEKFQNLLKEGDKILKTSGWDGKKYSHHPNDIDYRRFRTEAMNLLKRVCGENSDHYLELKRITEGKESSHNSYYFKDCFGVLQAAYRDFEGEFLFNLKVLVAAELLGDFIEQADTLVKAGYYQSAASLAGAVLENALRKLCQSNNIDIPEKTKIDRLNAELARAEIYNKLVQKQITALADIRNNADHGHFDSFKIEDVENMVSWIRRFMSDYLVNK